MSKRTMKVDLRLGGFLYLDALTGLAVLSLLIAAFAVAAGQQERGHRALAQRRLLAMRAQEAIVRL